MHPNQSTRLRSEGDAKQQHIGLWQEFVQRIRWIKRNALFDLFAFFLRRKTIAGSQHAHAQAAAAGRHMLTNRAIAQDEGCFLIEQQTRIGPQKRGDQSPARKARSAGITNLAAVSISVIAISAT